MVCTTLIASLLFGTQDFKGIPMEYKDGDVVLEGYVSKPMQDVVAPVVLIVHQWSGLSDYEKMRADQLAALGYVAFAVDIYGKGNRPSPENRGAMAGKFKNDRTLFRQRLLAGYEAAKTIPGVEADNIAAIGYCFGGTGVLELARAGAPVKGVVSFHGGLDSPTPADGAKILGKVLVCHGADDPFVPQKDLDAFKKEMSSNGVDMKFVAYPGAVHSFSDKAAGNDASKGAAYNEQADMKSWDEMKAFLKLTLGK